MLCIPSAGTDTTTGEFSQFAFTIGNESNIPSTKCPVVTFKGVGEVYGLGSRCVVIDVPIRLSTKAGV